MSSSAEIKYGPSIFTLHVCLVSLTVPEVPAVGQRWQI